MDFIDLVDNKKRNRFKGTNFAVDIDLGNDKKNLSLYLVISRSYIAYDNFSFEMFEEKVGALFQKGVTCIFLGGDRRMRIESTENFVDSEHLKKIKFCL